MMPSAVLLAARVGGVGRNRWLQNLVRRCTVLPQRGALHKGPASPLARRVGGHAGFFKPDDQLTDLLVGSSGDPSRIQRLNFSGGPPDRPWTDVDRLRPKPLSDPQIDGAS